MNQAERKARGHTRRCPTGGALSLVGMALAAALPMLLLAAVLLAVVGGTFVYRLFLSVALRLGLAPAYLKLITALLVIIALAIPYIQKKLRHEWIPPAVRM